MRPNYAVILISALMVPSGLASAGCKIDAFDAMRSAAAAASIDDHSRYRFTSARGGDGWNVLIEPTDAGREGWSIDVSCRGKILTLTAAIAAEQNGMVEQKTAGCPPAEALEPID